MREESHRSCLRKSELFFARQLDDPNQLDPAHEISFSVHAIGGAWSVVTGAPSRRFCSVGQISAAADAVVKPVSRISLPGPRKRGPMTGSGVIRRREFIT